MGVNSRLSLSQSKFLVTPLGSSDDQTLYKTHLTIIYTDFILLCFCTFKKYISSNFNFYLSIYFFGIIPILVLLINEREILQIVKRNVMLYLFIKMSSQKQTCDTLHIQTMKEIESDSSRCYRVSCST